MNRSSFLEVRSLGAGSLPCGSLQRRPPHERGTVANVRNQKTNESGVLGRCWWKGRSGRSPEGPYHWKWHSEVTTEPLDQRSCCSEGSWESPGV